MRHVLLLRGINLGATRRVPMAQLRERLSEAGYGSVATHLQSGNVVLESPRAAATVASEVAELIAERFGFEVPVIARSRSELAAIVAHDPHGEVADVPKLYQVTFLAQPISAEVEERLRARIAGEERLAVHGRELYAWHPDGIARSKLAGALAGDLGVTASARNWTTVRALLELAT